MPYGHMNIMFSVFPPLYRVQVSLPSSLELSPLLLFFSPQAAELPVILFFPFFFLLQASCYTSPPAPIQSWKNMNYLNPNPVDDIQTQGGRFKITIHYCLSNTGKDSNV